MGRKAKLKQARREGTVAKKEPVYNYTQTQLDNLVLERVTKIKRLIVDDVVIKVTETMLMQSYDVLNCYFGFGDKRLQRFRHHMDSVSEMITNLSKEDPNFDYFSATVKDLKARKIDVEALVTGDVNESLIKERRNLKGFALSASDFDKLRVQAQEET